jgi:putative DNA primase/helicase
MSRYQNAARAANIALNAGDQNLERITNKAIEALRVHNDPPVLFKHDGRPVRVSEGSPPSVEDLTVDRVINRLAKVANWYRNVRGVQMPALPPMHVARNILASPVSHFPLLRRVIAAPVFNPDGTLLVTPGYDNRSGILYCPGDFVLPEVSVRPSAAELAYAKELVVQELMGDFPLTGDAERCHAVCAFLLPFVQCLIDGPTPIHLFSKPASGTGATLLVQVVCYPALGYWIANIATPKDESEWRRTLFAKLRGCPMAILLDNAKTLDSAALAAAITSSTFEDRIIGSSETRTAPVACLWLVTANNPFLSSEIARRTIGSRLDAQIEHPELRTGFRHPHLKAWVADHRDMLVWAGLSIVQAWIAAGRPRGRKTFGMFESWAETIGGILDVNGIPGFLENLDDHRANADLESRGLAAFVAAWHEQFGEQEVGVADLWDLAQTLDLGGGREHSQKIQLGKLLDSLRDRQIAGLRVEHAGERKHAQQYRLRIAGLAETESPA